MHLWLTLESIIHVKHQKSGVRYFTKGTIKNKAKPITTILNHAKRYSFAQLAKKLVHHQLNKLHIGTLVLIEGNNSFVFGDPIPASVKTRDNKLYGEMHIHDINCYINILTSGSIGAAESFITEDWTSPNLTAVVQLLVRNIDILNQMEGGLATLSTPLLKIIHSLNENSEKGSRRNIAAHYDLGNAFFKTFLDPTMMYSSGIFPNSTATMEQASKYKLKRCIQYWQEDA